MIKSKHRLSLLLMYGGFLLGSLYYYVPGIIFYYDQVEGQGEITQINQKRVYLDYYHEDSSKQVSVSFREGNKLYLEKLDVGKIIRIKYSKMFPSQISIIDFHSAPGMGGLVMIVFFLTPLILFRWIEF